MHLIINGKDLGEVIGCRQNRELSRWCFLMVAGYYIEVEFGSIKLFERSPDFTITLF